MPRDGLPPAPFDPARAAERLKLLAEPVRLAVLLALERRETNVGELAAALGTRSEAISHRLQLLRLAGLVEIRREGKSNFYRLTDAGRVTVEGLRLVAGAID